jgi:predicted RNA-binding protein Jag
LQASSETNFTISSAYAELAINKEIKVILIEFTGPPRYMLIGKSGETLKTFSK